MPLSIPLLERIKSGGERIALEQAQSKTSYARLYERSVNVASMLLEGADDLKEKRIAFMVAPGSDYAACMFGIWMAGGIAVPLCLKHPLPEIEYVLDDTGATCVLASPTYASFLDPLLKKMDIPLHSTEAFTQKGALTDSFSTGLDRRALILYTSGTTSRPKGVVTTHRNIQATITALIEAWGWRADDRILNVLPLHHTHGITNIFLCAMWAGATCLMENGFDAEVVWNHFVSSDLTLFMAVPTIYHRLIQSWEACAEEEQPKRSQACAGFRLMVSGSAALPVPFLKRWQKISGHTLLERYGMTEIGMALSNPLEAERRPGFVGLPLPGVTVRLMGDSGKVVEADGEAGEIQVKGANVFLEYWGKPQITEASFEEGWFRTGDRALREAGYFKILGRMSVDIIKSGGYKISALEIEDVLRTHPHIAECAVVGVEDEDWGERVCAGVVLVQNESLDDAALKQWAKKRLAPYKVPSRMLVLEDLPRNVMGKVTKPALKELFV